MKKWPKFSLVDSFWGWGKWVYGYLVIGSLHSRKCREMRLCRYPTLICYLNKLDLTSLISTVKRQFYESGVVRTAGTLFSRWVVSVDLAKLSGTPRNVKGEVTCPGRSNNIRNHFVLLKLTGTSDRMSQLLLTMRILCFHIKHKRNKILTSIHSNILIN